MKTADRWHDVVIVGARVAGSATAMLLARLGHDVVVVDQRFARSKGVPTTMQGSWSDPMVTQPPEAATQKHPIGANLGARLHAHPHTWTYTGTLLGAWTAHAIRKRTASDGRSQPTD